MRIALADYSGHPFQVQLSREFARRGHIVSHLYFAEFQSPKGRLAVGPSDPETLEIEAIALGEPFAKYSLVKRRFQEARIGKRFASHIAIFRPDVVVASNMPLDSLRVFAAGCHRTGAAFVFWQQDIYSIAIERFVAKKFGRLGLALTRYYKGVERAVLQASDCVVPISGDFLPILNKDFGISSDKIHLVENWAPLDEISPRPKNNPWSRSHDLVEKDVVHYTGTLGIKHDPAQILAVAETMRDRPNTAIVVASEGPSASWLAEQACKLKLNALRVVGFQPFEVYSDVLGSADVLLSILESNSSIFSVPSKVLSYLCAGRPVVISAPPENLASRIITATNAGVAVATNDRAGFISAIERFLSDPAERARAGRSGRAYAEATFDIAKIGDRFEGIVTDAYRRAKSTARQRRSPEVRNEGRIRA